MKRYLYVSLVGLLFLIMFSAMVMFAHTVKAEAQTRSKYMDLGDKYLKEADDSFFNSERRQSYALQALAAYVAAQKE